MDDPPVYLDGRRSPAGRMASEFRRDKQRDCAPDGTVHSARNTEIRGQLLAGPADNWAEVAAKTGFLLGHFARTAQGQDERMQKLIDRAMSDIARLIKREERKR